MIAVAMTAMAENFEYNGLKYSVIKAPDGNIWGEVEVEGYVSTTASSITIPPSVTNDGKTYNVTKISNLAFAMHPNLTSVRISYGVTRIYAQAFNLCPKLTTVYLPSSVKKIDDLAFAKCDALTSVYIARLDLTQITFGIDVWPEKSSKMTMYVPHGSAVATNELLKYFSVATDFNLLAYDLYMNDGTVSIVTTPASTPKGNNKCTIVGFNPKGSLVTDGAYVPQRAVSTPTGYESKFEYTAISLGAFEGSSMTKANLTNLTNVTSIGNYAFRDCAALTQVTLPKNLQILGTTPFTGCNALTEIDIDSSNKYFFTKDHILYASYASGNTALICVPASYSGDAVNAPMITHIVSRAVENQSRSRSYNLPYGLKTIESDAFYNSVILEINIPSSATDLRSNFIHNCTLTAYSKFIYNLTGQGNLDMSSWFKTIGSTATLYVPRESTAEYTAGAYWKKYFSKVNPNNTCAYDMENGYAKYTVTSDEPTTISGVTYGGTVKAVHGIYYKYAEDVKLIHIGAFTATNGKVYAPTRIDTYAFKDFNVLGIILYSTVSSFASGALSDAPILTDVTLLNTGAVNWDGAFFGNNASNFTFWVDHKVFNSYFTSAMANWNINGGKKGIDYLAPFIKTNTDNTMFSCAVNVTFSGSGLNAYTALNGTDNTLKASKITNVGAGAGVLVTGIKNDEIYRLPRVQYGDNPFINRLVGVPGTRVDIYQQQQQLSSAIVNYRWDPVQHKFIRPTGGQYVSSGSAYLTLTPNEAGNYNDYYLDLWPAPDGKKGDANGDGVVDVTDANILINILLGKDSASNYNGRADVTSDGIVDIADVKEVLNIILGK